MPGEQFVLALDAGTSSVRAMLFDETGAGGPAGEGPMARRRYRLQTTVDGGVEAGADEMLEALAACIDETLPHVGPGSIVAVAMSTLASSLVGIGAGGRPVSPVYLYSDTRNAAQVREVRQALDERSIHQRTGCSVHTSYLPARFVWLHDRQPSLMRQTARWMSVSEYILYRFLGVPRCSFSVASWTGLLDRQRLAWDDELLAMLGSRAALRRDQLSPLADDPLAGLARPYRERWPALADVPWFPAWGDGVCSNIGSGCSSPAQVVMNLGTSGALRIVRGGRAAEIPKGLWEYRVDEQRGLLGGALSNAGNLLRWLRDLLHLAGMPALDKELRARPAASHGLVVLPFLAGERSPGWLGEARAAFVGLGLEHGPLDLLQAGLEAVAYRFALIYDLLRPLAAPEHQALVSGGGTVQIPHWGQILTDVLGRPLTVLRETEASARGAALLAWQKLGLLAELPGPRLEGAQRYEADAARHAIYRQAMERQALLYEALYGQKS